MPSQVRLYIHTLSRTTVVDPVASGGPWSNVAEFLKPGMTLCVHVSPADGGRDVPIVASRLLPVLGVAYDGLINFDMKSVATYNVGVERNHVLAICDGDKPVAAGMVQMRRKTGCFIQALGVLPAYRRQGLMRTLLRAAEALAIHLHTMTADELTKKKRVPHEMRFTYNIDKDLGEQTKALLRVAHERGYALDTSEEDELDYVCTLTVPQRAFRAPRP